MQVKGMDFSDAHGQQLADLFFIIWILNLL